MGGGMMGGGLTRRRMAMPMMGRGGGMGLEGFPIGGKGGGGGYPIGNPVGGGGGGSTWNPKGGGGVGLPVPTGGGGKNPWTPAAPMPGGGPPAPFSQGTNPGWSTVWDLLRNAVTGGDPNFGGAFGLNPPQAIMDAIRSGAIADAGAQERAARLGLQSRGDADPSTYGFQALMSQLGGQDRTARTLSEANLGLRQQQLQNYWNMLRMAFGDAEASNRARIGAGAGQGGGFDWGGLIGGVGSLAGLLGNRQSGGGDDPMMQYGFVP